MGKKITKTFTVDIDIYSDFEQICKNNKINRSKLIEDFIKDFVNVSKNTDEITYETILLKIKKFGVNSISEKELNFIKNKTS